MKLINSLVVALGVIAPLAYLIGVNFYQGSLSAFGVNPDLFPISPLDSYVTAYFAVGYLLLALAAQAKEILLWLFGSENLIYSSIAFIVLLYLGIKLSRKIGGYVFTKIIHYYKKMISALHWKNNDISKVVLIFSSASYLVLLTPILTIGLAVLWYIAPFEAHQKGFLLAETKRDAFLKQGCFSETDSAFSNCHTLKDNDGTIIYKGILVSNSGDMIAFFTDTGAHISKFPDGGTLVNELSK